LSLSIFIFIGPPGGGKGSISKLCVDNLGWRQLSTGNLCRNHISKQTEIGKKIDFIVKSGNLISDDIITSMVDDWLSDNLTSDKPVIFDGYPRTLSQAKALHGLFESKFSMLKLNVIRFLIKEEEVVKRLSSRLICSNNECQAVYSKIPGSLVPKKLNFCDKCMNPLVCRPDDEENAVKKRLDIYNKHEEDLINFYSEVVGRNVIGLDVEKPISDVFVDFKKSVI